VLNFNSALPARPSKNANAPKTSAIDQVLLIFIEASDLGVTAMDKSSALLVVLISSCGCLAAAARDLALGSGYELKAPRKDAGYLQVRVCVKAILG
jgi:hypothetical protein